MTSHSRDDFHLEFSPDGDKLVFASPTALTDDAVAGERNLYLRDLGTGAVGLLATGFLTARFIAGGATLFIGGPYERWAVDVGSGQRLAGDVAWPIDGDGSWFGLDGQDPLAEAFLGAPSPNGAYTDAHSSASEAVGRRSDGSSTMGRMLTATAEAYVFKDQDWMRWSGFSYFVRTGMPDLGTGVASGASPDRVTVDARRDVVVDVLANDAPGATLELVPTVSARGGTVERLADDRVRYTPPRSFEGADAFQYLVHTVDGGPVIGAVRVEVEQRRSLTVEVIGPGSVSYPDGEAACRTRCVAEVLRYGTVSVEAVADPGGAFMGWDSASGCMAWSTTCQLRGPDDQTVVARFAPPLATALTVEGEGLIRYGGEVCPPTCTQGRWPGTGLQLEAVPASGWSFVGWTGACSAYGAWCWFDGETEATATATFAPHPVVTVTASSGGKVQMFVPDEGRWRWCEPVCSAVGPPDRSVGVWAEPLAGFVFAGWTSTETSHSTCDADSWCWFLPTTSTTLTATFRSGGPVGPEPPGSTGPPSFEPVPEPQRLLDTRTGDGAPPAKVGETDGTGAPIELPVLGRSGVPNDGVAAVALNLTVTDTDTGPAGGYVSAYPCGDRPEVSSLNFTTGQTVANSVIVPVSPRGTVCLYVYGRAQVLADISGWFLEGSRFQTVPPARALDTRAVGGSRTVRGALDGSAPPIVLDVQNAVGASWGAVSAVSLNLTVTNARTTSAGGYVTVYPCGVRPDASNLNFVSGATVANAVISPVAPDGTVCIYVYGEADVLVDINGWFAPGGSFGPVTPARLFDTRSSGPWGKVGNTAGLPTILRIRALGQGGIPWSGVAAVSLNLTATETSAPAGPGFVTVFPCGGLPNASSLNFSTGQTVANAVIAPVSAIGEVCFHVNGDAHLIGDVNGWFSG